MQPFRPAHDTAEADRSGTEQRLPAVRCELPTLDVRLVNHARIGVFALVDDRLDDDTADAMLQLLAVGLELDPTAAGPQVTWPTLDVGLSADAVRAVAAAAATRLTRDSSTEVSRQRGTVAAVPSQRNMQMTSPDDDAPDLMTDRAHSARIYDYLLGGKTHYLPDRDAGDATLAAHPDMRGLAQSQRGFMRRTAAAVAAAGVDQFLDLGTGIPTEPNLHQIVQHIQPAARVVYVDNDPIVLAHANALMTSTEAGRVEYLQADVRDPAALLTAPLLLDTLDLTRPIGVSLIGLSHFLDDTTMAAVLAAARRLMVSGSHLTINVGTIENDPDGRVGRIMGAYQAAGIPTFVRTYDEVVALMDGLELLDPGIVSTLAWRPDPTPFPTPAGELHLHWGVVGRVP